ncbi:MAG: hypothetical protein ACM3SR_11410 [Ignavibacteriales bacterium]
MESSKTEKNQNEPVFEIKEELLEELRQNALLKAKNATHNWVQKGPYIHCTSCEFPHGFHIGTKKLLVGVKNGEPILQDI